jgi:1-acyl-sn-glycerol-3-phosphate acyltransferase
MNYEKTSFVVTMLKNYAKREVSDYNWWRALAHYVSIYFVLWPYFKIFYKAKIEGRENIPKNESFIVASNHMSYLDPVIVSTAVQRPVAYMAKKELFEIPVLREVIDFYGAFAVSREKVEISTIKTAKAVVSTKKWIMAMFPQGGREKPGKITRVNPGFAYIAKLTGAKILPVSIVGSHEYNPAPFGGNLVVKIGKPIDVPTNLEETAHLWVSTIAQLSGFEYEIEKETEKVPI